MLNRSIRRIFQICAALLFVSAGTIAVAEPASASSSGCTAAPSGYVCGGVDGSHKYISHLYVVRGKASRDFICNYQGLFTIYDRNGNWLVQKHTSRHSGCSVGRAWFDWNPRTSYPTGAKVCAGFYERDVRQGMVCFKLR